jgi:hypothetical protein
VNNAEAGLASSTWLPAAVLSNDTFTVVFPLGVVTVMVAVYGVDEAARRLG